MFDFEAKQTNEDFFNITNIKKHQILHLIKMKENGAIVFLIIYFNKHDTFFKVEIDQIINSKKKRISYLSFVENAIELKIIFPGILDILNVKNLS
jgi:recombination protein U